MKRLIYILALLLFPAWSLAATVYLDDNTGCAGNSPCYTSWSAAASAAGSGGTVKMLTSTWTSPIDVNVPCTFERLNSSQIITIDGGWNKPGSRYDGMLDINVAATVKDVTIKRIHGRGVRMLGNNSTLSNVQVSDVSYNGIYAGGGLSGFTIEKCNVTRCAAETQPSVCEPLGFCVDPGDPSRPPAIQLSNGSYDGVVRGTIVHDNYFEPIDIGRNSHHILIDQCQLYGNERMQLYLCNAQHITIRDCLIYGVPTNSYGDKGYSQGGLLARVENAQTSDCRYIRVQGCMIAGESTGICLTRGGRQTTYLPRDWFICHSTVTDNRDSALGITAVNGLYLKNNIFFENDGDTLTSVSNASNLNASKNLWFSGNPVSSLSASNDIKTNPLLARTSMENLSSGDLSPADFAIGSSSLARDDGVALTTISSGGGSDKTEAYLAEPLWFNGDEKVTVKNTGGDRRITLTGINYSTKRVTWTPAVTIANGDGIYLRHFSGTKPDVGAYEYPSQPTNNPPTVSITTPGGDACWETNDTELSFSASGTDPDPGAVLTYQWYDNNEPISGATSATLGAYGVDEGWADGQTHTVKVIVSDGHEAAQDSLTITVKAPDQCGEGPGGEPVTKTWGERQDAADNYLDDYHGVWEDSHIRGGTHVDDKYGSNTIWWEMAGRATYNNTYMRAHVYQIDFATLPTGSTVSEWTIPVYNWDPPDVNSTINLYELCDSPFVEADVTFNKYDSTNTWDQSNHEETGTVLLSGTVTTQSADTRITLTATEAGKTFLASKAGQVVSLIGKETTAQPGGTSAYYSSEYGAGAEKAKRPYTSVTYTPPASAGNITDARFVTPDGTYGSGKAIRSYIQYDKAESFTFAAGSEPYLPCAVAPTDELMPNQVDRDFSAASAWENVNLASYNESGDLTITANATNQYCTLPVASFPTIAGRDYVLKLDVASLVATWSIRAFDGDPTYGTVSANGTAQEIVFTAADGGGIRIVALASNSSGNFDNFSLKNKQLRLTLQTASGLSQTRHYLEGTITPGQNSTDLAHIDAGDNNDIILPGSSTATGSRNVPTAGGPGSPDYYASIIVDTTPPQPGPGADPLPATLYLSDENYNAISTTNPVNYTTPGKVYLCLGFQDANSGNDIGCFNEGPAPGLSLITNLFGPSGSAVSWYPFSGIGDHKWLLAQDLDYGYRTKTDTEWQLTNSTIQQAGGTKIVDIAGNELSTYDTEITDVFGNVVKIYVANPYWIVCDAGCDATDFAGILTLVGRTIAGDQITYYTNQTTIDTDNPGESGNEIIHNLNAHQIATLTLDQSYNKAKRGRLTTTGSLTAANTSIEACIVPSGVTLTLSNTTGIVARNLTIPGTIAVTENATGINWAVPGTISLSSGKTLTVTNCFFAQTKAQIQAAGGTVSDTNCQFGVTEWKFKGEAQGDYRLRFDSPLRNAGTAESLEDFLGKPIASAVGAYGVYGISPAQFNALGIL